MTFSVVVMVTLTMMGQPSHLLSLQGLVPFTYEQDCRSFLQEDPAHIDQYVKILRDGVAEDPVYKGWEIQSIVLDCQPTTHNVQRPFGRPSGHDRSE